MIRRILCLLGWHALGMRVWDEDKHRWVLVCLECGAKLKEVL